MTVATTSSPSSTSTHEAAPSQPAAWRVWATRHRVISSMLGGLVGVHIASMIGFWLGGFGLKRLDWNTANGLVYLPKGDMFPQFMVGWTMHYLDGILFGLLFAIALHPRLPGPTTELGNILKGLIFGTILAIVALLVLTPLIYAPARNSAAGFFSTNFGWQYILGVFIFHWLYGAHLGLVYNPLNNHEPKD